MFLTKVRGFRSSAIVILGVLLAFMVLWKFSVLQRRVVSAQKKSGSSAQALDCLGESRRKTFCSVWWLFLVSV